jgi:hypothetical protein
MRLSRNDLNVLGNISPTSQQTGNRNILIKPFPVQTNTAQLDLRAFSGRGAK